MIVAPGSLAVSVLVGLLILLVVLKKYMYPTFDPREPPVLRPRVPFVGHLIAMIRESSSWYTRLYNEQPMAICTLPVLTGKIYVINSPSLISAAMRNKDISFDPFQLEFAANGIGMSPSTVEKLAQDGVLSNLHNIHHKGLAGDNVYKMMAVTLNDLSKTINGIVTGKSCRISNVFDWLQGETALATLHAMLGDKNPLGLEAVELLRDYDKSIATLAAGIAPTLLAPKAFKARARLREILLPYYKARYDTQPDCSPIMSDRASYMRELGYNDDEIATVEVTMPWAATTNTTVSIYWLFAHLFSQPDYVQRVREEVLAFTKIRHENGRRVATIEIVGLEKKCKFLMALFREALRLYDDNISYRRVTTDTTLQDDDGREYLLKKGTNVQWTTGITALNGSCWGNSILEYDPNRWLNVSPEDEKSRRAAFIPFGGGKYLCPGRQFATAVNLGFVSALALGFEIKGVEVAPARDPYMGGAMRRPIEAEGNLSVEVWRREGWEDVEWRFDCAGY